MFDTRLLTVFAATPIWFAIVPDAVPGGDVDTFCDEARGYTPVTGLADRAGKGRSNPGADQTVVLKHGIVIAITVQVHGNSNDDAANESLARVATVGL